jgi:hypothetical protein
LLWTNSLNRKHSKIRSKPFLGTENIPNKMTFVSCFVKLHYFAKFHSVPFRSELQNGLFWDTRNHREWALYFREQKSLGWVFPWNYFGTEFWW